MSRIVAISALLCLLGLSAAAQSPDWPVPVGRPDSPERDGVFVGSFGHGPYFPSWRSVWPVGRAPLITTKLSTTMDAEGLIAGDRDDPFAHSADQSFEFPRGSGIQYLFGSYMILGGIVNGDTLASN